LISQTCYSLVAILKHIQSEYRVSWERFLTASGIFLLEICTFGILISGSFFYNLFYLLTIAVPIEYTIARLLASQKIWDHFEELVNMKQIEPKIKSKAAIATLLVGISIVLIPVDAVIPYVIGVTLSLISQYYWLVYLRDIRKVSNNVRAIQIFKTSIFQCILIIVLIILGIIGTGIVTNGAYSNVSNDSLHTLEGVFSDANAFYLVVLSGTIALFRYVIIRGVGYDVCEGLFCKKQGMAQFDVPEDERKEYFLKE